MWSSIIVAAHAAQPDALLLAPAHATAHNDILLCIKADHIPLICFISRPVGIAAVSCVGSDDRALARAIAGYLFAARKRGGRVVTLEGHPDAMTTAPRAAGFRDAANERRDLRITNSRVGFFQRDGGYAASRVAGG